METVFILIETEGNLFEPCIPSVLCILEKFIQTSERRVRPEWPLHAILYDLH